MATVERQVFAFGDTHGDLRLVKTLLVEVSKVAVPGTNGLLQWNSALRHTTVIICGDFTDRFRGSEMDEITTEQAIREETAILRIFEHLIEESRVTPERDVHLVVLCGNHEFCNLFHSSSYLPNQVSRPHSFRDIRLRREFVTTILQPFMCKYSHLSYYVRNMFFSHAGLHAEWTFQVVSFIDRFLDVSPNSASVEHFVRSLNKLWTLLLTSKVHGGTNSTNVAIEGGGQVVTLQELLQHPTSLLFNRHCAHNPSAYRRQHLAALKEHWGIPLTMVVGHMANTEVYRELHRVLSQTRCPTQDVDEDDVAIPRTNLTTNDTGYILQYATRSHLHIVFLDCLSSQAFDSYNEYLVSQWKYRRPSVFRMKFFTNDTVCCSVDTLTEHKWEAELRRRTGAYRNVGDVIEKCQDVFQEYRLSPKAITMTLRLLYKQYNNDVD